MERWQPKRPLTLFLCALTAPAALSLTGCSHSGSASPSAPASSDSIVIPPPAAPSASASSSEPAAPPIASAPGGSPSPGSGQGSDPGKKPGNCGLRTSDWCPSVAGDPCGEHKDVKSCRADPKCKGMPYRGESVVACKDDGTGFASNCPTVGCMSR